MIVWVLLGIWGARTQYRSNRLSTAQLLRRDSNPRPPSLWETYLVLL